MQVSRIQGVGLTRSAKDRYSCAGMAIERARTVRGALAGAVAAGLWALQQPLDKRVFGCEYDDVALLGMAVTRSRAWFPLGLVLHMQNGALFGAVYANVAPSVPLPGWSRGPLAGAIEHLTSWPAARLSDRLHPARDELAPLSGSRRAFAQATWRHLLFGTVLGELERRLNAGPAEELPVYDATGSVNGHHSLEEPVSAGPA